MLSHKTTTVIIGMLGEHDLRLRAPPSANAAATSAAATVHHALYASHQLRSAAGAEPASVPSSLNAPGGTTRRCDFPALILILVALPHADPHLLRLRVSHNRKKAQEYNERHSALALFSVLCPYAAALWLPPWASLRRRSGRRLAPAFCLRRRRHVGMSRGGFVPSAPFGRAHAADKSAAF